MGETRVDLHHLLEDLRDAYSGPVEETILTEVIANALDSGALTIDIETDPVAGTLTVRDEGSGMTRRDLRRYHDLATSTKVRGQGIGFAGVGIKLGLLISSDVVTETRRGQTHIATTWALTSRRRAPWRWVNPPGWVATQGTAVRLMLRNPLSALLDAGFVEQAVKRHFPALLEPPFTAMLSPYYGAGVAFRINGRPLDHRSLLSDASVTAPIAVRIARQRKPSATGYLVRTTEVLPDDLQGLAVSTFGKVIKRGWDWVGVSPADPERVAGLIEVPALAGCLTLNKSDFIRSGPRGATFLAYRKAIQEVVAAQLAVWGGDSTRPPARERVLRDRDIEAALEDLAREFPLLGTLVERRRGGQKSLPIGAALAASDLFSAASPPARDDEQNEHTPEAPAEPPTPESPPADTAPPGARTDPGDLPQVTPRRRRARYGLDIRFESRPEDSELGRLVESTVWINDAHPAYGRAVLSRSTGYHIAVAVGLALAPLTRESHSEHEFVIRFLARWGEALGKGTARKRPTRNRGTREQGKRGQGGAGARSSK